MKLKISTKEKIGYLIGLLIENSGYSNEQLCIIIDTNTTTLQSVIDGTGNYASNLLMKLILFFGMRLDEISGLSNIILTVDFQKLLVNYHSSIDSVQLIEIKKQPSISFMLLRLVKYNRIDKFMQPHVIRSLMKSVFEAKIPAAISTDLLKLEFCIESGIDPDHAGRKVYKGLPDKLPAVPNGKEYIPSLIQLQREIKVEVNFEKIYLLSEILLTLSKEVLNEKELIAFIEAGIRTNVMKVFLTPLIDAKLISASGAGENKVYQITEKGRGVMNLG